MAFILNVKPKVIFSVICLSISVLPNIFLSLAVIPIISTKYFRHPSDNHYYLSIYFSLCYLDDVVNVLIGQMPHQVRGLYRIPNTDPITVEVNIIE